MNRTVTASAGTSDVLDTVVTITMPARHVKALLAILGPNSLQSHIDQLRERHAYDEAAYIQANQGDILFDVYSPLQDVLKTLGVEKF